MHKGVSFSFWKADTTWKRLLPLSRPLWKLYLCTRERPIGVRLETVGVEKAMK